MSNPRLCERTPHEGKQLLNRLRAAGIDAQNVTRNRKTGLFFVDFKVPDVDDFDAPGIPPANEWARRIRQQISGVEVVDTHDTIAAWRPHQPVLLATVVLRNSRRASA